MDGEIVKAGVHLDGYGNYVVVKHADGWRTWYGHLDSISCAVGDLVRRHGLVGFAGSSGRSTGPHLHLTVQHWGHGSSGYNIPHVVDPQLYL